PPQLQFAVDALLERLHLRPLAPGTLHLLGKFSLAPGQLRLARPDLFLPATPQPAPQVRHLDALLGGARTVRGRLGLLPGDLLALCLQRLALCLTFNLPGVEFLLARFEVAGDLGFLSTQGGAALFELDLFLENRRLLGGDGGGLDPERLAQLAVG